MKYTEFLGKIFVFYGILFFQFCNKQEQPPEIGLNIFHKELHSIKIFQVDTVIFRGSLEDSIVISKFVQEKVISVKDDDNGVVHYVVEESISDIYPTDNWIFNAFISCKFDQKKVVEKRNNQSKMTFIFPIVSRARWNKNLFNNESPYFVRFHNLNNEIEIKNNTFIQTISVKSDLDIDDIVEKNSYLATYAPSLGLIYERSVDIKKQEKRGKIYEKKLVEF